MFKSVPCLDGSWEIKTSIRVSTDKKPINMGLGKIQRYLFQLYPTWITLPEATSGFGNFDVMVLLHSHLSPSLTEGHRINYMNNIAPSALNRLFSKLALIGNHSTYFIFSTLVHISNLDPWNLVWNWSLVGSTRNFLFLSKFGISAKYSCVSVWIAFGINGVNAIPPNALAGYFS